MAEAKSIEPPQPRTTNSSPDRDSSYSSSLPSDSDETVYYAYAVSDHPTSKDYDVYRYRLFYSTTEVPEKFTGFAEGHLYFPKIVSVGRLTADHISLCQCCIDKDSADEGTVNDAMVDMDAWSFKFQFVAEGSNRMKEEGAYSAYYMPDESHYFLAIPLWEVYFIPASENNIDEDVLVVKTYSMELKRFLLEVIYPYQLLMSPPGGIYHFFKDLSFTFGSMRFVRKFVPHRNEFHAITLRQQVAMDIDSSKDEHSFKYTHCANDQIIEDGIEALLSFIAKRDDFLQKLFNQSFRSNYYEPKESYETKQS